MTTETNIAIRDDLIHLTDNEIDAVAGGINPNPIGPCKLGFPVPLQRTGPGERRLGVDLNP